MDGWLDCAFLVAGLAAIQSLLMLLFAFEQKRHFRSRLKAPIRPDFQPRTTLIVPCKGNELGLDDNLAALFVQDYPNYEICFVVESDCDPALEVIALVQSRFPRLASRVVVAGLAQNSGQKVFNLQAAARALPADSHVVAFIDSDAHPHPAWLARLVDRLRSNWHGIATGYRWYVPVDGSLPNLTLSALNASVASVMGGHGFNLIWGGSWATRVETFRGLNLPAAWDGALTDDLVVSRLAQQARLRVVFEPHCLLVSSAKTNWSSLVEFIRRQFVIVRIATPKWWLGAAAGGLFTQSILWGALLTSLGVATTRPWLGLTVLAAFYVVTALRLALHVSAARPFLQAKARELGGAAALFVLAWPLLSLFNLSLILSTAFSRTILWRGITYRLDGPNQTRILSRPGVDGAATPASRKAA